jgi:hypothetical protein
MPEKTNYLFAKLMEWLDENVKETYLPKPNPGYDAKTESHTEPYINLVDIYRNGGDVVKSSN